MPEPQAIRKALGLYLRNREEFFATLLPRIPHPRLRALVEETIVSPPAEAVSLDAADACASQLLTDDFWTALLLLDLLKKPGFGRAHARTAISFEECLQRMMEIEEVGVLVFSQIDRRSADARPELRRQIEQHRKTWAGIQRLADDVRYHRITLVDED